MGFEVTPPPSFGPVFRGSRGVTAFAVVVVDSRAKGHSQPNKCYALAPLK